MGFAIFFLVFIQLLVFNTQTFQIWAHYLDFEGAKNIYVLQVLILDFGGCWKFLTGFRHLDLDLDFVTGLCYTHVLTFGSPS